MAADEQVSEPVTFAGGVLDRYRHVCAFLNGDPVDDPIFDPFIRQAVDAGDRLLYFVEGTEAASPVNRLRHLGYDPAAMREGHRWEVRSWEDTYLRRGGFEPTEMLQLLDRILVREPPRIRLLADMGWAAGRPEMGDQLIEFESRANFIHPRHRHIVICAYDVSLFDGSFIVDILRTHPMVLIGGVLHENPFFVPPAEFLGERGLPAEDDG